MTTTTLPITKPDQNVCDTVNQWSWTAHLITARYIQVYQEEAQRQGKKLVILDLFAGSGMLDYKGKFYQSPFFASIVNSQGVEKWILLEADADKVEALEARIEQSENKGRVELMPSSPNVQLDRLKDILAPYTNQENFIILGLGMPLNLELHFNTIAELSEFGTEWVLTHSLPAKAVRGPRGYVGSNFERISNYVQMLEWAAILDQPQYNLESLTRLFADLYQGQLTRLGYSEIDFRHRIDLPNKKQAIYVCYYSKLAFAQSSYTAANQVLESQFKLGV